MTNYAYVLVPILTLLLGGGLGYCLGRYQNSLVDKIRTLEQRPVVEEPEAAVTFGSYTPANENAAANDTDHIIGIAEAKTPQRVSWDAEQATEREGRGIGPT